MYSVISASSSRGVGLFITGIDIIEIIIGHNFNDSIKMAYHDYVMEDIKLNYNLSIAKENTNHNNNNNK